MRKEVREYLKTRLWELIPDKNKDLRDQILREIADHSYDSGWAQGWDDCKEYYDIPPENIYGSPDDER